MFFEVNVLGTLTKNVDNLVIPWVAPNRMNEGEGKLALGDILTKAFVVSILDGPGEAGQRLSVL